MTYHYDTASAAAETGWHRQLREQEQAEHEADQREAAIFARQCELALDRKALAENAFCDVDYRGDYSTGYLMADMYLAAKAAGLVSSELHERIVERFERMATDEIDGKPSGLLAMFDSVCRPVLAGERA